MCDIPWNKAPRTGSCHCALSLAVRRTQMAEQLCWFRWPLLVMAACAEAGCCCCSCSSLSSPPQNSLLTSLAFAPDSEAVSAARISLMASSSSFIYFFPAIAPDPQSSALFRLLCMTQHSFRNVIPIDMNVIYSDSKTYLKLWISSYLRVPKMSLLDWLLCVACYYPTTPTVYPSTKRGISVGPSVAVNIELCGYFWFLSISFVWII